MFFTNFIVRDTNEVIVTEALKRMNTKMEMQNRALSVDVNGNVDDSKIYDV